MKIFMGHVLCLIWFCVGSRFFILELQYIVQVFQVLHERLMSHFQLFRDVLKEVINISSKVFTRTIHLHDISIERFLISY